MSHTDPTLAIPVGLAFAAGGIFLAINPERFLDLHGWPQTLTRVLGRGGAVIVLRICGAFLAVVTLFLVYHETIALIG